VKLSLKTATKYRPSKINAHQKYKIKQERGEMIPSIKLPDSRFIVFFLSDTISSQTFSWLGIIKTNFNPALAYRKSTRHGKLKQV